MPDPVLTIDEENEVSRASKLARYRKVRDVFLETFGPAGKRTPHGTVLLEELERFTNWRKPIREQDTTGQTDLYRTAVREGRREVMQAIYNLIEWKESEHVNSGQSGA